MSDTPRTLMAEVSGFGKPWWAQYPIMRKNAEELERENAALRADRERLLDILQRWQHMADEWYAEADQYGLGEPNITAGMINDTRAAIDAARKEQP